MEYKNRVVKRDSGKRIRGTQGNWYYDERCLVYARSKAEIRELISKQLESRPILGKPKWKQRECKREIRIINIRRIKDDATGKIIASYAHPLFWAPFIIVGDSTDIFRSSNEIQIPLKSSSLMGDPYFNLAKSTISTEKVDEPESVPESASDDTQVGAIFDDNQRKIEPWTGIWNVEGERNTIGQWAMKQRDKSVVSTLDSLYEIKGVAQGTQLKGRIKADHGLNFRFVLFISLDGRSFKGKIYTNLSSLPIKGERID